MHATSPRQDERDRMAFPLPSGNGNQPEKQSFVPHNLFPFVRGSTDLAFYFSTVDEPYVPQIKR